MYKWSSTKWAVHFSSGPMDVRDREKTYIQNLKTKVNSWIYNCDTAVMEVRSREKTYSNFEKKSTVTFITVI